MIKRPIAVTVIAWLLILVGFGGFAGHLVEVAGQRPFQFQALWVPILSLLAAVAGIFVLRRHNWARWLALAWMAFHVAISFFDSISKVLVHVLLLLVIAWALFGGRAKEYFRNTQMRA